MAAVESPRPGAGPQEPGVICAITGTDRLHPDHGRLRTRLVSPHIFL